MSSLMRWKTSDGRQIRIVDMTDEHLLNTFAYARRKFREQAGVEWFPGITGHRRSALVMGDFLRTFYAEATKRGLKWNASSEKKGSELVDMLFVSAKEALKPHRTPISELVAGATGTFSLDLGDE